MNEWLNRIAPGRRITLAWKAVGRIGLREVLILGGSVIQAIWLIFMVSSIAFELRFVCALVLTTLMVCWASIPIRGLPAEKALFKFIKGKLGAKQYIHQTAQADDIAVANEVEDEPKPQSAKPSKREKYDSRGELGWAAPNLGLIAFVFMCLVTLSSAVMVFTRGVPGLA